MKTRPFATLFASGVAFVVMSTPLPAAADLPAPTGYVNCSNLGSAGNQPFSCTNSFGSASLTLGPYASLTGEVQSSGDFAGNYPVSGYLEYYFDVVGPSDSFTDVPIDIDYHMQQHETLSGVPSEAIITAFSTASGSGDTKAICSDGGNCNDHSSDIEGTLHFTALANFINTVDLQMEVGVGYGGPAEGYAYVDPLIYIDPSFADAADYSIVLSPGVGNGMPTIAAPVPEPETWALMLGGLGLIGTLMRRRRLRR